MNAFKGTKGKRPSFLMFEMLEHQDDKFNCIGVVIFSRATQPMPSWIHAIWSLWQ